MLLAPEFLIISVKGYCLTEKAEEIERSGEQRARALGHDTRKLREPVKAPEGGMTPLSESSRIQPCAESARLRYNHVIHLLSDPILVLNARSR
jgi:hypothetical protein